MHLTPGFLERIRRSQNLFRLLSVLLVATACSRRPPASTPLPEPVPQEADSIVLPLVQVVRLSPDSADYTIHSQTITTEITTSPFVVDTLKLEELVHMTLIPVADGRIELTLSSDSGYDAGPNRLPPPETIQSVRGRVVLHTRLSAGHPVEVHRVDQADSCAGAMTLISPLVSAAMTWFVAQITNHGSPNDSLSYSTCSAGIVRRHRLSFEIVHAAADSLRILLSGTVLADSSRALPMLLRGTLNGKGTALPSRGSAVLPRWVLLDLLVELSATAGAIRHQSFRQHVQVELTRVP